MVRDRVELVTVATRHALQLVLEYRDGRRELVRVEWVGAPIDADTRAGYLELCRLAYRQARRSRGRSFDSWFELLDDVRRP